MSDYGGSQIMEVVRLWRYSVVGLERFPVLCSPNPFLAMLYHLIDLM